MLRELVLCEESEEISRNPVWFLFISPTSFFLLISYAESFFLAFTLGCFLSARIGHWALVGLLGAGALTRLNDFDVSGSQW